MDIRSEVAPLVAKLDAYEKNHGISTYMVYQLKAGDETRDLRFEPFDRLAQADHTVDLSNYELIYAAPVKPGDTLEDDYGMIDGVINNGRRGEELEKAKEATVKRPSIRERLADAKRECAERPKPEKQHSGRNTPEHGDL